MSLFRSVEIGYFISFLCVFSGVQSSFLNFLQGEFWGYITEVKVAVPYIYIYIFSTSDR